MPTSDRTAIEGFLSSTVDVEKLSPVNRKIYDRLKEMVAPNRATQTTPWDLIVVYCLSQKLTMDPKYDWANPEITVTEWVDGGFDNLTPALGDTIEGIIQEAKGA